jgi:hypothetical protein
MISHHLDHTKLLKILDTSIDCKDKRKQMMTKKNTKIPKILNTRHRYEKPSFGIILNYLKYLIQALTV